jgi:hypothetical protein
MTNIVDGTDGNIKHILLRDHGRLKMTGMVGVAHGDMVPAYGVDEMGNFNECRRRRSRAKNI